jgi:hypothetical protein
MPSVAFYVLTEFFIVIDILLRKRWVGFLSGTHSSESVPSASIFNESSFREIV